MPIEKNPDWPISAKIIYGVHASFITLIIALNILAIAIWAYRSVITAVKVFYRLMLEKKLVFGELFRIRYVKAGNRFYLSCMSAGWPSPAFTKFIQNELVRVLPFSKRKNYLQILILAITRKCGLRCEHCFEWNNLGSKEVLEFLDLKRIIHDFQDRGISLIQLSGGEPLNRFNEMLELLRTAKPGTDFWLVTSGSGLSLKRARQLKHAGLTGVTISLDHWSEEAHNKFRKNAKSFQWVQEAVLNCHKAGLSASLSLCATKKFVSNDNLWKYLRLAKGMGAGFVRILEPRQAGRYTGKDVALSEEQVEQLKEFYLSVNSDSRFRTWPILLYPGYHQRQYGCFGAGERFLYIDSKGEMHACPFCRESTGNVLATPVDVCIKRMATMTGCLQFKLIKQDFQHRYPKCD